MAKQCLTRAANFSEEEKLFVLAGGIGKGISAVENNRYIDEEGKGLERNSEQIQLPKSNWNQTGHESDSNSTIGNVVTPPPTKAQSKMFAIIFF